MAGWNPSGKFIDPTRWLQKKSRRATKPVPMKKGGAVKPKGEKASQVFTGPDYPAGNYGKYEPYPGYGDKKRDLAFTKQAKSAGRMSVDPRYADQDFGYAEKGPVSAESQAVAQSYKGYNSREAQRARKATVTAKATQLKEFLRKKMGIPQGEQPVPMKKGGAVKPKGEKAHMMPQQAKAMGMKKKMSSDMMKTPVKPMNKHKMPDGSMMADSEMKGMRKKMTMMKKGGAVKHPGFQSVAGKIAAKEGVSKERASAILAASTRKAGPAAKKRNPNLKRVKG